MVRKQEKDLGSETTLMIACHEAGHVLSAYLLGVPFKGVTLKREGTKTIGIEYLKPNPRKKTFYRDLANLLVSGLSGHAGELTLNGLRITEPGTLALHPFVWLPFKLSSLNDAKMISKVVRILNLNKDESQDFIQSMIKMVIDIFSNWKNRIVLVRLAFVLFKHETIKSREAKKIISGFFKALQLTKIKRK